MKFFLRTLSCLLICTVLIACGREPDAGSINITESIATQQAGLNGRNWRTAFDIRLDDKQLVVVLRVRLVPGPRITQPQLDRLASSWETAVETAWSNKFALIISGTPYPIYLDLVFTPIDPVHTVIVRDEASHRVDQLNWSRWSSPATIAHEIGHMLGAYDEYPGGGQDPLNPLTSNTSLMGGAPGPLAQPSAHHFKVIVSWAQDKFSDAHIVSIKLE